MTSPTILSAVEATVGKDLVEKIHSSKILLVGAGGIGCELLKTLALTGFRSVEVIDLDTIDVSNLNRQLLFRSQHVGMPKCTVACEVATELAPATDKENNNTLPPVRYIAHHGNVCDTARFNVPYLSQFDLVLNALDNLTARRRVNRLCLAAGVPLVEAGTTGYLGQVTVIDKESQVACYECTTQETGKVYPICTIRSTPSMPVHTIVWAKELYKLFFGEKVEESMLFEDTTSGDEPSTYMQKVLYHRNLFQTDEITDPKTRQLVMTKSANELIHCFYVDEIQKQLDMDRYKTARKTPVPLSEAVLSASNTHVPPSTLPSYRHTAVWSLEDCVAEFRQCLLDARPETVLGSFDKDDDLSMKFVTAASNLRNYVFGIEPLQSYYSAKGIAGNIIPAIATTNAIVSGVQILQVFNILRNQLQTGKKTGNLAECCSYMNCLRSKTRNGLFMTAAKLQEPNPKCFVCRKATIPLTLNVDNWTLQDFLDKIVKKDLGFEEPSILIGGDFIWEEGQDADSDSFRPNLVKHLPALPCGGITHGTNVLIEDFSQDLSVEIIVTHQDVWEKSEEGETDEDLMQKFVIGGTRPTVAKAEATTTEKAAKTEGDSKEEDNDDDVCEIVDDQESNKRPPSSDDDLDRKPPAKKMKMQEVIEID